MSLLIERAEDYSLEDFHKVELVNSGAINFPAEYLLSHDPWAQRVQYYMGPKGSGKTTIWRKAISKGVHDDKEFLPAMFIFRSAKNLELLHPLKIAPHEVWGKRLETYYSKSMRELTKSVDALIYDDIHYMCEAVRGGELDKGKFIDFLNSCLSSIDDKKKVVLISEDMISYYAEKLKMKEFDEILPKFGMGSPQKLLDYDYVQNIDHMAFREVPQLNYIDWQSLFPVYGIDAEDHVKNFLFNFNKNPRAFIKFAKIFYPKSYITINDMVDESIELLNEKRRRKELKKDKLELYEFLLNFPVISGDISIEKFDDVYRAANRNLEKLTEIQKNLPIIEKICEIAAKKLKPPPKDYNKRRWDYDSIYKLRRKREDDVLEVQNILHNTVMEYFGLESRWRKSPDMESKTKEARRVEQLVNVYYRHPSMSGLKRSYETIVKMKKQAELKVIDQSKIKENLEQLIHNVRKNYIEAGYDWLLFEPFNVAFRDLLFETPTLEILSARY